MSVRTTAVAVAALADTVLDLPQGLDERQRHYAAVAITNTPPAPRMLSERLRRSLATQVPVVGSLLAFVPGLLSWLFRDALSGARGIARVDEAQPIKDLRNTEQPVWWLQIGFVVDGVEYRSTVRASQEDARAAVQAGVVPIVLDRATPNRVIVWWSALDVR